MTTKITRQNRISLAFPPRTPAGDKSLRVSMKGYRRIVFIVSGENGTGVTGSAITAHQAKDVAGTDEKPINFSNMIGNEDVGGGGVDTPFVGDLPTFTTTATDSVQYLYRLEISAEELDVSGGFDCISLAMAAGTNTTLTVHYLLSDPRYGQEELLDPSVD